MPNPIMPGTRPLAKRADHHWFRVSCPAWGEIVEMVYVRDEAAIRRKFRTDRDALHIERTDLSWSAGLKALTGLAVAEAPKANGQSAPKHPREAEVAAWLRAYEGRNRFVLDVQAKFLVGKAGGRSKARRLSAKQIDALAKVKDREAQWAKEREERPSSGLNLWEALPEGTVYAAADNAEGHTSFVRMDKVDSGKWAGWVFVKGQIGPDFLKVGSQRPDAEYRGQWLDVIRNVIADVPAAIARYGQEIGRCGVCNRDLTNEASRRKGIGPDCERRIKR